MSSGKELPAGTIETNPMDGLLFFTHIIRDIKASKELSSVLTLREPSVLADDPNKLYHFVKQHLSSSVKLLKKIYCIIYKTYNFNNLKVLTYNEQ